MKSYVLITTTCVGLLLASACRTVPKAPLTVAPGATGLETGETLRRCDGHDLPFLIALEGTTDDPDFPGLSRLPVLVAYPETTPVGLTATDWVAGSGGHWTLALSPEIDAISLGLDWLSFKADIDPGSGKVRSWSPDIPPLGFAAIYFVEDGAVWVYAWGADLKTLFPSDWKSLERTEAELHSLASLTTGLGGRVTGLDVNGGFSGAWVSTVDCFLPPGALPDATEATLFYSVPGELLFTSHAEWGVVAPATTPSWSWSLGTSVDLIHETAAGEVPLFAEGTDLVAFSYDREHELIMYSTDNEDDAPFMVAHASEVTDVDGTVIALVVSNVAPLLNHDHHALGASFSTRPSGSCGFDPQRILGERALQGR